MMEAECTRCKEIFVPHGVNVEDLIHCYREDGQECGGIGIIQGWWGLEGDANFTALEIAAKTLLPMEKHAREMPLCLDPDCEFHHPEVREY